MKVHILGRTGPRSQKGKAISALNAVKHGAYSKTVVLPQEDASERARLERELRRAMRPTDGYEERLLDYLVSSAWSVERFKLRLAMKQESIYRHLTPQTLAQLIEIPKIYQAFAPDYLKDPNTHFKKSDLKLPAQRYQQYLHLCRNTKGIKNYQMVFGAYQILFEGLHDFLGTSWSEPFLNALKTGLNPAWQQQPDKVDEALLSYAASLYYMLQFDELCPKIRVAMASWFFIERYDKRESDYHDDLIVKEINRFQSLLAQFQKYRKVKLDAQSLQKGALRDGKVQANEIEDSQEKSIG
jgi:hypothetical protein